MELIQDFLTDIGWSKGQQMEFRFNSCDRPMDDMFFRCAVVTIAQFLHAWAGKLRQRKDVQIEDGLLNTFASIIIEATKNASDHGNDCDPDKPISVTAWAGDRGFLIGVRDEGDFFKSETIKNNFEKKILPETDWKKRHGRNTGQGIAYWLFYADKLLVDTSTGTLYLMFLFEKP